jgi:prolyl-tRNA synthetase
MTKDAGKSFSKKGLTKKSENISEWYQDVVTKANLAEYSEVKGTIIIKPNGYAIWEKVQTVLDLWFKEGGVKNVYFPMFIPYSLLKKEKEHMEGFSPELAIVEHAGGEKLAEPLVVRPTSETIMYKTFVNWIQSYRDLPLKINQWCNVVRWEKRTYPFLRTSEFLWQEGHTAHATYEDAESMALQALSWYQNFYEDYFAISVYAGLKSKGETFAGADHTYSIELVMPDGKALQAATSHHLGDNFSKVFGIEFLDENGSKVNPFQTSWGLSTRSIGGLILSHGDDSGLVLPPLVAPVQAVVVPVNNKDEAIQNASLEFAQKVFADLKKAGVRVVLDDDFKNSLGFRINKWELEGVPLRLEIGGRELEEKSMQSVRRDTFAKGKIPAKDATAQVTDLLLDMQKALHIKSAEQKKLLTHEAESFEEFKKLLSEQKVFVRVPWCEDRACETAIKNETKATPRVLEMDRINEAASGKCFHCQNQAKRRWLFAQSY